MDSIGSVLGTIGGDISKGIGAVAPILNPVSGILGTIRNVKGQGSQDALTQQMINYYKRMAALSNNPAALAAMIQQATQPLSGNLVQSVMNPVQAQLMERGLGTSPNIATGITSQALAPYELESQRMALEAVMSMLGLPVSAGRAVPSFKPTDTSSFWQQYLPGSTQGGYNPQTGVLKLPNGQSIYVGSPQTIDPSASPGMIPDLSGINLPQSTPDIFGGNPVPVSMPTVDNSASGMGA